VADVYRYLMGLPVSPLAGRDEELSVMRELVAGVAHGRGGVAWVEGEPGIGKSALIAAGLAGAESAGCAVYTGSVPELLSPFPLRDLLDALGVGRDEADPVPAPWRGCCGARAGRNW
jgi:hypothetical protein